MKNFAITLFFLLVLRLAASAAVINVEFKFTPFTGDPAKEEHVATVPGKAKIFINNVPYGDEQEVGAQSAMVLFENRQVSPSVWLPMASAGPMVRKGKNKFRLEFAPNDPKKTYRAQLRWADVTDQVTEETDESSGASTNQADEGLDDRKEVKGPIVFEREFTADFALDQPWQHYPPVTALTEDDKQKIAALLQERAAWFKPDFAPLYQAIEENESLRVDDVRKAQCLEKAYQAGVRVNAPQVGDLDFVAAGGPEVVVKRKTGSLFGLDEKSLAPIKDEDTQMCVGVTLSVVYPGRLAAVHKPDGGWEIVY